MAKNKVEEHIPVIREAKGYYSEFPVYAAGGQVYAANAFGAKGDGTTDNTTDIQSAMDAAAVTGGVLFFPAGTFLSRTITWRQGVSIMGAGKIATTIKLKSGAGTLFKSDSFATAAGSGNSYAGTNGFFMSDLTLDGNASQQTDSGAADYRDRNALIKLYSWGYRISNVRINNAKEIALYTEHDNSWDGENFNEYQFGESIFENLYIKNYGKVGWVNRGPHDSHVKSVYISSYNASGLSAQYGYYGQVDGTAHYGSQGLIADNLHVWGEHAQNAIRLNNTNIIQGKVYAEGATGSAIYIGDGSTKNNFEAIVGYAANGVEIASSNDNNIKVWHESTITTSLFKVSGNSAGNVLDQLTGYGGGAVFTLSSYTGGNNVFRSGRAYAATMFSGTPATTDRIDTISDNFPDTSRLTTWRLPVADTYFDITNAGVNLRTLPLIKSLATPASATATGTAGQITWDASFIYICTATNTWKRVAIATW